MEILIYMVRGDVVDLSRSATINIGLMTMTHARANVCTMQLTYCTGAHQETAECKKTRQISCTQIYIK